MKRRLIGEAFPVKEVGAESSREKSIRHGHISTLHVWWARKPLASSRATIYASLVTPKNAKERDEKKSLIAKLSKWESAEDRTLIDKIRREILDNNDGVPPKVLDPFGGGGSIPLESLRLGCETYSSDINPVAVLIQKCAIEYPQKFRVRKGNRLATKDRQNSLLADIKRWSDWVYDEAFKEIGKFYFEANNSISVGYITARTVTCHNPKCGVEIPLMHNYWLSKKRNNDPNKTRKIAVYPYVDGKKIRFKIIGTGYERIPNGFNPQNGNIAKATAVCIACGTVMNPKTLKDVFWRKESWDKQVAVIVSTKGRSGKTYRPVDDSDMELFRSAAAYLNAKKETMSKKFKYDPVPDEIIPTPENEEHTQGNSTWVNTNVHLYKMTKWRDLFNSRQTLAMIVFLEKIRLAHQLMLDEYDAEYAKIVTTYLGIMLDRLADKSSNLARYNNTRENIEGVFNRQGLSITWYYAELNPFANNGWKNMQDWVVQTVDHCSQVPESAKIIQESSMSLSYQDNYFDAVFTDPPYYDNIHYSSISDFFYVWLKRSVGHLYPELFSTPLTPKSDEAVETLTLVRGLDKKLAKRSIKSIKDKDNFEHMLSRCFIEIHRVLKQDGIAVIVYSHKSTEGWETLINSILDSGLVITGAWPINTEMKARMTAKETAALSSSIYMVARKTAREEIGFYRDVKKGLSKHVRTKLKDLWGQGISGADFFISAIGASIEVFGKYDKVVDDNGEPITTPRLLEDIRKIVTEFAVNQVLDGGFGSQISQMTRFYVLWRWAYGNSKVPFDDALKMAQGVGISIEQQYNRGFIKKDKEFIRVLDPTNRDIDKVDSREMIDVLHKAVLLWKDNRREEMLEVLKKSGFGGSETFFRVAQAISESNPGSEESRLLDGFLSAKASVIGDVGRVDDRGQAKLFE